MNNHLITKLTKYCLYGLMGIAVANIFSNVMQINLMNGYYVDKLYTNEEFHVLLENNDNRVDLIHSAYAILFFLSIAIIGRWFFVAAKINHLSGVDGLEITPGSAVGWYFIPIACLVMPYISLKETFRASFASQNWKSIKVPYDFPIWWATYLLGNLLATISYQMEPSQEETFTYEISNQISYFEIAQDCALIINALCLLRIVKIISNNQKDKQF